MALAPTTISHSSTFTIFALVIVALTGLARAQPCPDRCHSCTNGVADCKRRSLTAPPKVYPPDIKVIDLLGNHVRVLGSRTFRQHQTAEILKIGGNKITALRNDAFRSFPHLMSLDLNGNKISRIYPRALHGRSRLRTLSLNRNKIRRLAGIFQGAPNLHQLNLASNRIVRLAENDLAPLTRIHYLDLRDNKITRIHSRAFEQLRNIRYLFLNNNPIASALNLQFSSTVLQLVDISNCRLPRVPQTFPSSISDLRLGKNEIMQINHTDFQEINDLQMLALNENELHFLADGTFSHLTQLREIWLRGNNLVYVPRDIPPNVQKLYMDSNRLQEIEPGLFSEDSGLEFFSAENNQLRRVHPDTFVGMRNLKTINLQGNEIQTLETGTFSNLDSLYTLLISNNPLQRIEPNVFVNLPNLTHLHISYLTTEIMDNDGNFLSQMPQLQTLQVMGSPGMGQAVVDMIESADEREFVIMDSVTTLDLSYNNLRGLSPRVRILFPNVQSLLLDGNPFHCGEDLSWLQEWMTSTDVTFHNSEDLVCHTPDSLSGRSIRTLSPQEWRETGVSENGNRELSRQRQKRRHDEKSYWEIQNNGRDETQAVKREEARREEARREEARREAARREETRRREEARREEARREETRRREENARREETRRQQLLAQEARREEARRKQVITQETRRQDTRYPVRSSSNASLKTNVQPSSSRGTIERSLAVRAEREERRRKQRTRSKSRTRKGGKRRGKGRRRRKGRKNGKRRGSKRDRSRVKRYTEV